jgi:hypothetical protein
MKAESVAATGGAVSPPPAPSGFRNLQASATEAPAGAVAGLRLQKSVASTERAAVGSRQYSPGKSVADGVGSPDTRKIGDRTFVLTQDIWVDEECNKHPEASQVVIPPESEEYSEILNTYPELRDLRPVMIFWKGRELLLR